MNGASFLIHLCSFNFNIACSFGKNEMDLFKEIIHDSLELITPFNSDIFLIPKIKSTFSYISETNIYTSNL